MGAMIGQGIKYVKRYRFILTLKLSCVLSWFPMVNQSAPFFG